MAVLWDIDPAPSSSVLLSCPWQARAIVVDGVAASNCVSRGWVMDLMSAQFLHLLQLGVIASDMKCQHINFKVFINIAMPTKVCWS